LSQSSITEHQKIAVLIASRIFPTLDEFALAHNLTVSPESGLLVLLAQRLAHRGHSPDAILATVDEALKAYEAAKTGVTNTQPSEEKTSGEPVPSLPLGENIVPFPSKK
jgi:fatty acid-binding protein DegV